MIKKKNKGRFLSLDGSNRTCANGFVFRVCCFHNGLLESDNIFSFQFNGVNGWSDLFNPAMLFLFSLFFTSWPGTDRSGVLENKYLKDP